MRMFSFSGFLILTLLVFGVLLDLSLPVLTAMFALFCLWLVASLTFIIRDVYDVRKTNDEQETEINRLRRLYQNMSQQTDQLLQKLHARALDGAKLEAQKVIDAQGFAKETFVTQLNVELATLSAKSQAVGQVKDELQKQLVQLERQVVEIAKKAQSTPEDLNFVALQELSNQAFPGVKLRKPLSFLVDKQEGTTRIQANVNRSQMDNVLLAVEDDAKSIRVGPFELNRQQALLFCACIVAWLQNRKIALPPVDPGSDDGFVFNDWLTSEPGFSQEAHEDGLDDTLVPPEEDEDDEDIWPEDDDDSDDDDSDDDDDDDDDFNDHSDDDAGCGRTGR